MLLFLIFVVSLPLSNRWEAFFRLALASLRSFAGRGYQIPYHLLPFVLQGSIGVPFWQLRVCEISLTSRLSRQKAGKGALEGRELWTRWPYPTFLIQMVSERWWPVIGCYPLQFQVETGSPGWVLPHRPQGCLLSNSSHPYSTISQNCLWWQPTSSRHSV